MRLEVTGYGLDGVMKAAKIFYSEGALVQFQQSQQGVTELQGSFLMM